MQNQSLDRPTAGITLVVGTGFLKCAAAIGMVQVLQQEGILINSIIGSSTGALLAAGITVGHTPKQLLNFLEQIGPLQVFPTHNLFIQRFGPLTNNPFKQLLEATFGSLTFANTQLPLQIIVANFTNGNRLVLTDGALVPALLASSGFPGLMPPVSYQGHNLVDGAFVDPLPITAAIEAGAEVIVAMGFELPYLTTIQSIAHSIYQRTSIAINQLLVSQIGLSNLAHHNEIILINPRFGLSIEFTDIHHLPFVIEQGAEATRAVIPYLKTLLAQP
jgi:NTE family protein